MNDIKKDIDFSKVLKEEFEHSYICYRAVIEAIESLNDNNSKEVLKEIKNIITEGR